MMDLLTVPQAAELLKVNPTSLYEAIRAGRLRAVDVLGRKALLREDVLEYQRRTQSVGPRGGRPRKSATGEGQI